MDLFLCSGRAKIQAGIPEEPSLCAAPALSLFPLSALLPFGGVSSIFSVLQRCLVGGISMDFPSPNSPCPRDGTDSSACVWLHWSLNISHHWSCLNWNMISPKKQVFLLSGYYKHFQQFFFHPVPPSLQLPFDHKPDISCAAANLLPPQGAINLLQSLSGVEDTTPTCTRGSRRAAPRGFPSLL